MKHNITKHIIRMRAQWNKRLLIKLRKKKDPSSITMTSFGLILYRNSRNLILMHPFCFVSVCVSSNFHNSESLLQTYILLSVTFSFRSVHTIIGDLFFKFCLYFYLYFSIFFFSYFNYTTIVNRRQLITSSWIPRETKFTKRH